MARDPDTLVQEEKTLLIWYYDRFLSGVILGTYWDEKTRYYKLPTSKVKMELEPPTAPHKVLVPVTLEAFGLFTLDNCRNAWKNMFELKKNDSAAVIPRGKEDSEGKYKAKWNLPDSGSKEFGGIHPDGLKVCLFFLTLLLIFDSFFDNSANHNMLSV